MNIYIASDHAGYDLKGIVLQFLQGQGHTVEDLGPSSLDPHDDYPDFILPLAKKVAEHQGSFGIIIGASGQGEAMAANRIRGARAAVYYGGPSGSEIIKLSRQHNDANILSIGAHFVTAPEVQDALAHWLQTPFSGDERHRRRLAKF